MAIRLGRPLLVALALVLSFARPALAQTEEPSKNLAPGFTGLPKGAKVALMPTDMELFSISGGGVLEPKADWTEAATRYFHAALAKKRAALGFDAVDVAEKDADALADLNALHGAVAQSIAIHHFGPLQLPTKAGRLDWSMGESVQAIRKTTGADYALFSWIRDSYASAERKAVMVGLALLGVGIGGGIQTGYASLVDLSTGRVLWFSQLLRVNGDLREAEAAAESLDALLETFPVAK